MGALIHAGGIGVTFTTLLNNFTVILHFWAMNHTCWCRNISPTEQLLDRLLCPYVHLNRLLFLNFTCKNPADSAPSFSSCVSFTNNCNRLPRKTQPWTGLRCMPSADLLYMPFSQWSELKETRLLYWLAGGLHILEDLNHEALLRNIVQRAREYIPAVFFLLLCHSDKRTSVLASLCCWDDNNYRFKLNAWLLV